ncbi:MAG: hypothetical protein OHK0032_13690 [Thermodesulfovibrionales bacterium]
MRILSVVLAAILVFAVVPTAFAGTFDEKCAACHRPDNKPAPSKDLLVKKFKSTAELIKAAKASKNPMMKAVQGNDELLRNAAESLGLK